MADVARYLAVGGRIREASVVGVKGRGSGSRRVWKGMGGGRIETEPLGKVAERVAREMGWRMAGG